MSPQGAVREAPRTAPGGLGLGRRRGFVLGLVAALLALTLGAAAAEAIGPKGARSLGDPLFPQIGNGGYDVRHYEIDLDYDPATNEFESATTTITAVALKNLGEFSLDFQDLPVSAVTVDGEPAQFEQVEATPQLSEDPDVTQPMKLVVAPASKLRKDTTFVVRVDYSGTPEHVTDPDTSIEGWIRACFPLNPPQTCDGAFVVNEPIGAQSWFPSNNYPTDKATFDTKVTVPTTHTAFGVGELVGDAPTNNGDGTHTWHWSEDDPTATYLTTATVGLFDYVESSMLENLTGRTLPIYNGIDSSSSAAQKAAITATLSQAPAQLNFLGGIYGPYPFDSIGAVVDRAAGVGYALEVQTKAHYSGGFSTGNPNVNIFTQLHEIAHQWIGNSITLGTWLDIWFNEGWATWSEWIWDHEVNGGPSPEENFDDLYENLPASFWTLAPADLDGDPANLFSGVVYDRGAMVVQGVREILGEDGFAELVEALTGDRAYGNITTAEFMQLVEDLSGFNGQPRKRLRTFLQQWLYGEQRPTLLPEDVTGP